MKRVTSAKGIMMTIMKAIHISNDNGCMKCPSFTSLGFGNEVALLHVEMFHLWLPLSAAGANPRQDPTGLFVAGINSWLQRYATNVCFLKSLSNANLRISH